MLQADTNKLRAIRTLPSLIAYLRDELGWPIDANYGEFDGRRRKRVLVKIVGE